MSGRNDDHKSSMRILRKLAQEIAGMTERERHEVLRRLAWQKNGYKGNWFWPSVARYLLSQPEQLQAALKLTAMEIDARPSKLVSIHPKANFRESCLPGDENAGLSILGTLFKSDCSPN